VRGRPPLAFRACIGLVALAGLLFTGALLLSDRAPGLMRRVLGGAAERLWARIDAAGAPTALGEEARTRPDFVVHMVVWAVVTMLVALTVWSVWGAVWAMVGALAASVTLEVLQGRWTHSRAVEFVDVVANTTGVLLGGSAALGVMGLGWLTSARRPPGRV
jgi:VanZ family protein